MLFNSLHFLVFFPLVVAIYFQMAPRLRWIVLLLASYYFYMAWRPVYALLMVASTAVDYFAGYMMSHQSQRTARRPYLLLSILSNMGLLFAFKYLGFFTENIQALAASVGLSWPPGIVRLVLPVGISFYSFQTLSYSIDVYRGEIRPELHVGRFALFVSFFPQLVAGPIERASRLLPQLATLGGSPDAVRIESGLRTILWGYFKKVVIADRVAVYVNAVYADPSAHAGAPLLVATVLFSFQIYCDFSGYSDIAIGAARIIGVDLSANFRAPYLAGNIREFWSRWHISLTTWFRDYVYIPLGGNRGSTTRRLVNVAAVFLISGIWHGAAWNFVAWGAIHAAMYLVYLQWTRHSAGPGIAWTQTSVRRAGFALMNFTLVTIAWVFFRADSIQDAGVVLHRIATMANERGAGVTIHGFGWFGLLLSALLIVMLIAIEVLIERGYDPARQTWPWRVASSAVGLSMILSIGMFRSTSFIYFQF